LAAYLEQSDSGELAAEESEIVSRAASRAARRVRPAGEACSVRRRRPTYNRLKTPAGDDFEAIGIPKLFNSTGGSMGIRFLCPNGHKLNVKADLAGKRASCPECGVKLVIPAASPEPSGVPISTSEGKGAGPPNRAWHVRPAGGGQFGPATDAMFRAWIAEGRVTADSLIQRDDWADWKLARDAVDDLPIPLAAVPVATPSTPPAARPSVTPPAPIQKPAQKPAEKTTEKIEIPDVPLVPEPSDLAAIESLPSDASPSPATPLAAPIAATQYKLQRSRSKKTQLTLAIVMLVAVLVLAAVLIWVIRNSGSPAAAASIQSSFPTVDLGRHVVQSEDT
jgi:GYF domain 2